MLRPSLPGRIPQHSCSLRILYALGLCAIFFLFLLKPLAPPPPPKPMPTEN